MGGRFIYNIAPGNRGKREMDLNVDGYAFDGAVTPCGWAENARDLSNGFPQKENTNN